MPRSVMLVEFTPSGGLFHFAYQLGEALAQRGHRVELVTGRDPELVSALPGMSVTGVLPTWHPAAGAEAPRMWRRVRRPARAARYLAAWWVLARRVRRARPDVVQLSTWRFPLDGWLAGRLAGRADRPVLVHLAHAPRPFNEQRPAGGVFKGGPLLARGLSRGYRSMDAVLVLGEHSAAQVRAGCPGVRRLEIVPHGDEGIFLPGEADVGAAGAAGPVALFFGTLQAYKGVDLLLAAFPQVRGRLPGARLIIAGAPSGEVDTTLLARRAGAIPGVELRLGYVPLPEVAPLLMSARLVVLPYRHANASGVAHLAHSFARPVVTTAVGDLAAAVEHEVTGLVVPPGDTAALAEAMTALLGDPAQATRLGGAGRARQAARSAWPRVARQVERVYEDCLADRGPGRRAHARTDRH